MRVRARHAGYVVGLTVAACLPTSDAVEPQQHAGSPESEVLADEVGEAEPSPPAAPPEPVWEPGPDDLVEPLQPLDDPSGHALDAFYAKLAAVEEARPGATARITHLGDSTIGLDLLTHAVRRRLQSRFGDAGPGYLLLQRYHNSYKPKTVIHDANGQWNHCYIAYQCRGDGRYGLGGVTFTSKGGARTKLSPMPEGGDAGRDISSVELWYAAAPGGGKIDIVVDASERHRVDTRSEAPEDRWLRVEVDPGPHKVEVRAAGYGKVRAYGVVLEREGPGVVYDAVSMIGAYTGRLRAWNQEHMAGQLSHRDPDLLVMTYGGNDLRRVVANGLTAEAYEAEYDEVLRKVRAGKPDVPCLITSVIDHGRSGKQTVKPEHVEVIVGAQKKIAARHGCAFFNTYVAMGGAGSIHRWRAATPRLAEPDLKHLNPRGHDLMGENIYRALMAGYVEYRRRGS